MTYIVKNKTNEHNPDLVSKISNHLKKQFKTYMLTIELPIISYFGYNLHINYNYNTVPTEIVRVKEIETELNNIRWHLYNPEKKDNINEQAHYLESIIQEKKLLDVEYKNEILKPGIVEKKLLWENKNDDVNLGYVGYITTICLTALTLFGIAKDLSNKKP